MIKETYITSEIAKFINSNFDCDCEFHKYYWGYESGKEFLTEGSFNPEYDYPAYTIQMVMKWLREVHGLHIIVYFQGTWKYEIEELPNAESELYKDGFNTYEDACMEAIKVCLTKLK